MFRSVFCHVAHPLLLEVGACVQRRRGTPGGGAADAEGVKLDSQPLDAMITRNTWRWELKLFSEGLSSVHQQTFVANNNCTVAISSLGFPCSSAGKESTCNAGDPGLIPASGRSPGEGIDYPLQYFLACLV